MSMAILCPTTRLGPPPDPLGSTFSLIPYRLDTTFTCFHLSFFLELFFATLSTESFMELSRSLFRIFDQGHSGGQSSRHTQSIVFFWATRVPVRSCFSLASVLKNGSLVLYSGTSGRSDVSTSKYFLPHSAFDPQVHRPWKAARQYPACLYPNDVDANFCQACGSRTCLKKFVVSTKTIDHAEIARRFQEFNDVLKAKPY